MTLEPAESGFVDTQTGSTWTVEGEALEGALTGSRLVPLERTYTAYWGAWSAFHQNTRLRK